MIERVMEAIKSSKDKKAKVAQIKSAIRTSIDGTLFQVEDLDKEVQTAISEEIKMGKQSRITRDAKGYYKIARKVAPPKTPNENDIPVIDSLYEGTAGEMAVISELLFNEYNANKMMIDKGIDIVAAKDNVYYYVQVKTSYIRDGKVRWQIKKERFNSHISNQLKYVFVARYQEDNKYKPGAKVWRTMFFILSSNDIEREASNGTISMSDEYISVKVCFNQQSGEPELYNDSKKSPAQFYLNNFKW